MAQALRSKPDEMDISDIQYLLEKGELKVPQFQRDFVWNIEESAKLMDSIIKGYPIGAFTLWKTKERLRSVKNIGGLEFPESPNNDYVDYVLDGQQRITSIYACLKGVKIGNADYRNIYVDLTASEEDTIVVVKTDSFASEDQYISLQDLLEYDIVRINKKYKTEAIAKISDYQKRLTKCKFSIIQLTDAPLDTATEIFTRINTTGKSLNVFEIMCAKTYYEDQKNSELKFDLFEKRKLQLEKWNNAEYSTVSHQTVLQAMSICIQGSCKRRDILNLDKEKFRKNWEYVDNAFDQAIDYMKSFFGIPVSKLLPYDALLVPIVYYFFKKKKKPEGENIKRIQNYFWRCVLSKHFTEGVEGKLASDCNNIIIPIIKNQEPEGKFLEPVDISFESIKKYGNFSLSSAYVKGLVCLLAAQKPRSFADGAEVIIDNAWLSQSNSKNYHHFFPKAYMKKQNSLISEDMVNHIANITIVDGYLNKAVIKDKAPSEYMAKFIKNPNLNEVMKTHLIDNLDEFGILRDNYNIFFKKRIEAIQKQLRIRLQITEYDKE